MFKFYLLYVEFPQNFKRTRVNELSKSQRVTEKETIYTRPQNPTKKCSHSDLCLCVCVAYAKWLFSNSNGIALVPVDQFKLHRLLLLCVSFYFSLSLWTEADNVDSNGFHGLYYYY